MLPRMQTNRRSRRASSPTLALEFLLEAEQERSGASSLSVATLDGMLLSGVGEVDPTVAAAASAMRMQGFVEHPLLAAMKGHAFAMSVVELSGGERVLLSKVDGGPVSRDLESGVRRILS